MLFNNETKWERNLHFKVLLEFLSEKYWHTTKKTRASQDYPKEAVEREERKKEMKYLDAWGIFIFEETDLQVHYGVPEGT